MPNNNLRKSDVSWVETFVSGYSSATNGQVFGRCNWTGASGATVAPLGINGGAARFTLGGDDADTAALFGPLAFEVDESPTVEVFCRFRSSDADKSSIFFGLSDAVTDTVIIEDEDGTLNTVATDAAGLLLEGEQDTTWQTVGVDTNTDKAQTAIGAGTNDITLPDYDVDSDWKSIGLEFTAADSGTMKVYLEDASGNLVLCATRTSFFDSSITFCPAFSTDDRGTAYTVDVAEFGWHGTVGTVFD